MAAAIAPSLPNSGASISFFATLIAIAVITWFIMMGLYCVLIARIRPTLTKQHAPCPDRWKLGRDGTCTPNPARDNCGKFTGSRYSPTLQTWFDKKTWADKMDILWDGL